MDESLALVNNIMTEVKKAVIGKDDVVKTIMTCILAGGHVLIDDIPGVGKTTLAIAFSRAMALKEKRIQFTPDVMPSDVTGFTTFDKLTNKFVYKPGAVICNMLLADEINRTSSRTQSALLEAMEEKKVTVDGHVYKLNAPFIVIATENPVGSIGTNMLPESQLDRFFIRITMGYPSIENEILMLKGKQTVNPIDKINSVISAGDLIPIQRSVQKIYVHDEIYKYVSLLADVTRHHPDIKIGVSPRGSIALCRMAQAHAYLNGHDYVAPEDIRAVIHATWNHRIILQSKTKISNRTTEQIIDSVVSSLKGKNID